MVLRSPIWGDLMRAWGLYHEKCWREWPSLALLQFTYSSAVPELGKRGNKAHTPRSERRRAGFCAGLPRRVLLGNSYSSQYANPLSVSLAVAYRTKASCVCCSRYPASRKESITS